MNPVNVLTPAAEKARDIHLVWQCHNSGEASRMVSWLKSIGVDAKAVDTDYFRDWPA